MNFIEMVVYRRCTSVHFSIQPTCTPSRDGQHRVPAQGMRAVGRSGRCGIKFLMLFRCADSFTWATRIPSSRQLYAAFR